MMNETNDKSRDRIISMALDYLRFPLALLVVFVHVINIDDVGIYMSGSKCGAISDGTFIFEIRHIINVFIRGISVPIYLFISGYVFFKGVDNYNKTIYLKKIKNRVHSLLIPYVIWNLLELLLIVLVHSTALNAYAAGGAQELDLSITNIFSCFWVYNGQIVHSGVSAVESNALFPLNTPLWFIRDLFCVAVLSPILYFALKRWKYVSLLFFLIIWLCPKSDAASILNQFSLVFFFFSLGAFMSINNIDVISLFSKFNQLGWYLYVGGALVYLFVVDNTIITSLFKSINIIGALIVAYNIALKKVSKCNYSKSAFLSSSSMFIYLAHSLICMRLYKVLILLLKPETNIDVVMCLILTYVLVISLLLGVYYTMSNLSPKLSTFVTGRKL